MAVSLNKRFCANHPDRMAQALCMRCRRSICQECATQWDGINYCVVCLEQVRRGATEESSLVQWALLGTAIGVLFYAASLVMVWFGAYLNFMF